MTTTTYVTKTGRVRVTVDAALSWAAARAEKARRDVETSVRWATVSNGDGTYSVEAMSA